MSNDKYIGMDVHTAMTSVAVRDAAGHVTAEALIETKPESILGFMEGQRGRLHVTLEEGTWAAWLYDLLSPHVAQVVVCDARHNALIQSGPKGGSDRCAQVGRTVAPECPAPGLPWRAQHTHTPGTGTQLSSLGPRCHARHEPD